MKHLLKKNYGNLPRRKDDDPFFAIWRHYHDTDADIVLSEPQRSVLKIYERAKDLYDQGFSEGETAKMVKIYAAKEGKEISVRSAYQYLRDALDIFGHGVNIDLNREKHTMIEIAKRLLKKFEEKGSDSAAAAVFQTLCKLYGFGKENDEIVEYLKSAKPIMVTFTTDADQLRAEAIELVQDIEFDDIKEEEDGSETA
jgi:hypothetical protein